MPILLSMTPSPQANAGRPDAEDLERALCELQERYPRAPLIAVATNGLTVAMPASVPRRENPVLTGGSGLHSVPVEERGILLEAFERVLADGRAECVLHPAAYGEVAWHGFDLRERHGVIVALIGTDVDTGAVGGSREMTRMGRPRLATIRKDERGFVTDVGGGIAEILGWAPEEMVGRRSLDFIHPDDHALAIDNWIEMLAQPGPGRRIRQRLCRKDGAWVWFETANHNLLEDPDHGCVVSEMVDISEEMAAQEALREHERLLRRLAETVPVGLVQIDTEGRVVYTNDRLHEITGAAPATTAVEQFATLVAADRDRVQQALQRVLRAGTDADVEAAFAPGGAAEPRFCAISLRALRHDDGTLSGAIACVSDVTESTRMREELKFRATFDQLTGCHNRASIIAALEADLRRPASGADRAVMFLDLDGFKSINDRYGHAAGDRQLRAVADLLRGSVRERDLVGRIGGDEFLVICPDTGGHAQALTLARRVRQVLLDRFSDAPEELRCSVSVGVAWCRGAEMTADALVAAADEAMYASKRAAGRRPEAA